MEKLPKAVEKGLEEITQEVTKKWAKGNKDYAQNVMNFLKKNIISTHLNLGKDINLKEGNYVRTLMALYVHALKALNGDMEKFEKCYDNSETLKPRYDEIRRLYQHNRGATIYDTLSDWYRIEVKVAVNTRKAAKKMTGKK